MRCSLALLVLAACGGASVVPAAPVEVQSDVTPAPVPVCSFSGGWSSTLRFTGNHLFVTAPRATTELFPGRLDVELSGGGWHLRGHADLERDHPLRLQRTQWLGEGVAVDQGLHVRVDEANAGRVHVLPHPATLEGTDLQLSGQWLPCTAVGLTEQHRGSAHALLSLPYGEPNMLRIGFPYSLSHAPGGAPFVHIQGTAEELASPSATHQLTILERQGDYARVLARRYGAGSDVILVGWVEASRLGAVGGPGGVGLRSVRRNLDHELCESTETLPLFVGGQDAGEEGAREEVGHIEPGTLFRVDERNEDWAQVSPLPHSITVSGNARLFVPGLATCTPAEENSRKRTE